MNFDQLADDVILEIFSLLSWESLAKMATVSSRLKRLSEYNGLWRPHFIREFPGKPLLDQLCIKDQFKKEYQSRQQALANANGLRLLTDEKFKQSKFYVLAAVSRYGLALEYASERLKDNFEMQLVKMA